LVRYIERGDTTTMLDSYLKRPVGWGLSLLTGKYPFVDSSKIASRYYVSTSPTTIANTQLAYSNGTNLVGSPNVTYASSLLKLKNTASTQTLRVEDAANVNLYTAITSRGFGISRSDGALGASGFMYSFGDGAVGLSARNNTLLMNDTRGILQVNEGGVTIEIGAAFNANLTYGHASSILDVLSTVRGSRPFPIMSTAQADAITGVQGLFVYENGVGPRWYNGTRKAYALESTFARGTATRVPFFDANGQITENSAFNFNGTQLILTPSTAVAKKLQINTTAIANATGIDIDLGGKYSGNATTVPKIAIYNDGTYQFGIGMVNAGMTYIVDHPTLAHNFYAGADSLLKFSITRSLNYFPQYTAATRLTVGTTTTPKYPATLSVESSADGLTSGIVVKNTSTTGAAYSGVFLESQDDKYSQFFSTNSTYTGYRSIQASTFGHFSNVTNGMAIQLDGSNASLRIGMGLSEIARFTLSGALALGTSSPDASAILQANSTTRGWLPPRWTAVQRTAIPSPATALFGYQTDGTEGLYIKAAAGFKRLLWEGDAVNTWLKPSLEAGSVNITQGRVNKLRFNQDSGYFHLKNGVIFLQHPTEKDPASALPQVIITSDTLARWNKSGAVVSIGSQLGSNNATGYGYTMVGSLTRGVVNGSICYFSSAYGYDVGIDSTIKVNAIGHKISANRVTDSDAYGGYITFAKDVNNSGAYGSWITVNRNQSFVYGRGISTRHTNEFLYGSSFSPKHTFSGSKVMFGLDSTFSFNITTKLLQLSAYGTSATTAAALSKTLTNYGVGFATDGTVTSREIKRDTTIYVTDADYDFSAAITTAQIASRFNRVIFWMTTTAAAGSDSELTLHTPDVNLMQVEYLIHSVDEAGGFANVIRFGTNNAVDSTNGLVSSYFPAAGQGVGIRAGLRSGVYKYRYY